MNIEAIKNEYPKSYKALQEWLKKLITTQLSNQPGITPEILNNFPIDMSIAMTFSNPQSLRALYNFFDLYMTSVTYYSYSAKGWVIMINGEDVEVIIYEDRSQAEEKLFQLSFDTLEKLLK